LTIFFAGGFFDISLAQVIIFVCDPPDLGSDTACGGSSDLRATSGGGQGKRKKGVCRQSKN
jgi:hypothetical protein